jgi:large subunit ribosomal protein L24
MTGIKIKKGDLVLVKAGKEKGKTGKVASVDPSSRTVVVEGLNIYKKNAKPSKRYPQGGIIDLAKPIDLSNLVVICSSCKKPTRVAIKRVKGSFSRVCKKCKEVLNVS